MYCYCIETDTDECSLSIKKNSTSTRVQGNASVFSENVEKQRVPTSLCSLIHVKFHKSVKDSSALINIMNLGNNSYSMLS